jgi:hypothetical protein
MVNLYGSWLFPLKSGQVLTKNEFGIVLMVMDSHRIIEKLKKSLKKDKKASKSPEKEPKMRYFKKMPLGDTE